jgi:Forkhead domain
MTTQTPPPGDIANVSAEFNALSHTHPLQSLSTASSFTQQGYKNTPGLAFADSTSDRPHFRDNDSKDEFASPASETAKSVAASNNIAHWPHITPQETPNYASSIFLAQNGKFQPQYNSNNSRFARPGVHEHHRSLSYPGPFPYQMHARELDRDCPRTSFIPSAEQMHGSSSFLDNSPDPIPSTLPPSHFQRIPDQQYLLSVSNAEGSSSAHPDGCLVKAYDDMKTKTTDFRLRVSVESGAASIRTPDDSPINDCNSIYNQRLMEPATYYTGYNDHGSEGPSDGSECPDNYRKGEGQPSAVFQDEESKPYAQLIRNALMSVPSHSMVLAEIYEYFRQHYPKYNNKASGKGWQNSIRHNLSMNAVSLIKLPQITALEYSQVLTILGIH